MMNVFCSFILFFFYLINAQAQDLQPLHLNLKQAMFRASQQNTQVLVANQRVLQALDNISVHNAALLPQVSGALAVKRQTIDLRSSGISIPGDPHVGPFNSFDTRARLTLEIFDPEAVGRIKSARASEKLSQAQLTKVKQDVLALVGAMFLEAQRGQQALELAQVSLDEVKLQSQVVETRLKQGLGSQADFNKAKANLVMAQYAYQAAEVYANETKLDLASALKIPLNQPIVFEENQSWADRDLQQAPLTPDEAVLFAQLDQSKAEAAEIKRSFLPKVAVAGDLGRSGKSVGSSSNTYSMGLAVNVPFWEGGSKQARLRQANDKIKENEILLSDTQEQSQIKIRKAIDSLTKAKAYLKAKVEQLNYATEQVVINQNRLKTGLGDRLETHHFQSLKALATDEKNEAQALYWTAKINLAHAMGRIEELFSAKGARLPDGQGPASGGN